MKISISMITLNEEKNKLLLFEPERSDAIELKDIISMVSSKG